jgi:type II secretory ATPase GspE/PulE/Tfp pilus assembly ATPase PilB-like protein
MGIEPFMISASLIMVCAQRLIRLLCPACKEAYIPSHEEKTKLGYTEQDEGIRLYRAKGCEACNHIGYKGRTGVHELLIPDDAMRRAMTRPGVNTEDIKQMAVSAGMTTLYWDGVYKVRQGLTSFEEILAKIRPDEFDSRPDWILNPLALQASS